MSFHEQSFASRMYAMGDEAEGSFEKLFPAHHRSGLNRPPMNVAQLSLKDRYTPDYLLAEGYVEVMGIGGRTPTLKLKNEKILALASWDATTATHLFVACSKTKRWWKAPLHDWVRACLDHGELKTFLEGKHYWNLHPSHFPVEPTAMEV